MFNSGRAALAAVVLLLGGCQRPETVHPALWQVDGPNGQRAWLMGTIHALPKKVEWRTKAVDSALAQADRVVLEVARIDDPGTIERSFAELAGQGSATPLRARVNPSDIRQFDAYVARYKIDLTPLQHQETWAAALLLAQAAQTDAGSDPANGIDRAVKAAAGGRPVEEFEGADAQLRIFDALSEQDQRDLLSAVISGSGDAKAETRAMEQAWAKGDVAALANDTQGGLLADPELRAALLTGRNRAWTQRLQAMLARGQRPFAAVGAAHLAGPDGLPAMLGAAGYRVTRLQ